MTLTEACAALGITVRTVEWHVYSGRLKPATRKYRAWTFTADEIERFRKERARGLARRRMFMVGRAAA